MTTVAVTGGVTMGTAGVASVILWASSGFPQPMPGDVALVLAGAVLIAVHAGYLAIVAVAKRFGIVPPNDPAPAKPADPAPAAPVQGA